VSDWEKSNSDERASLESDYWEQQCVRERSVRMLIIAYKCTVECVCVKEA
jgi:hypothetical protein